MSELPRALVVEDSPAWQEIVSELLTDLGLAVDLAADRETAVAHLRAQPHRVAVVDLSLRPDDEANRDGLAVLDAVRQLDPGCTPLLLTGFATVELAVSALTAYGAFTCLRKEAFRRAEFRQIIQRVLARPPLAEADPLRGPARPPVPATNETNSQGQALLVEDDAGWRSILAELLADAGLPATVCLSYGEALGHLRRTRYDLAVVDLSLASSTAPEGNRDGFQVLGQAHAAGIPAIVVSGLATAVDLERLYSEYAVYGCLEKQRFERAAFITLAQTASGSGRAGQGELAKLTPRERDVMTLLARGLTNKGIAHELVISENTVKRYLKSIFEKLDVDSRAAAVAAALTK